MVDWERGLITGRIFVDDDIYKREAEKLFLLRKTAEDEGELR